MIANGDGVSGNFTMPWLCVSAEPSLALRHPWTLLTYMVTHYGFLHLLFNMLWLYWYGLMLQFEYSPKILMPVYAGGGLSGALVYLVVTSLWPSLTVSGAYLVGASASVLALISASAMLLPNRTLRLFLIGEVKLKWVSVACVVLTLMGLGGGNVGGQSAHLGGVVFGMIYALSMIRKKKSRSENKDIEKFSVLKVRKRFKVNRDGDAVARAASGRLSDNSRLDILLDKIRMSGYSSLTSGERNELSELSRRIEKNKN